MRHAREVDAPVAHVHAHGDALARPVFALADGRDQLWDQLRGHVVDAVELEVFQCAQGDGLAATGHAGEHHQMDGVGLDDGAHHFVDHVGHHGEKRRIWCACRSMKVCAGSMPLAFRT